MKLSSKLWISFIISSFVAVVLFIILSIFLGKMFNSGYTHKTLSSLAGAIVNSRNLQVLELPIRIC